jgi:hypothetical protein
MQLDAEYKELQRDVVRPPLRERPANSRITAEMWKLVNHCTLLRRKGMLSQATLHGLGWQVKAHLVADCLLHASNTASEIKGNLTAGEFVEAWRHFKGWYQLAEDQASKACPETLALQMTERMESYTVVPPLGWSMPINVTPIPVPDKPPTDPEIREVVAKLQNGCAAGAMWMKAEHLKERLCGIRREETEESVGGSRGLLEAVCITDTGNLGLRHHAKSDELDGNCAPLKRGGGGITMILVCLTLSGRSWRRS